MSPISYRVDLVICCDNLHYYFKVSRRNVMSILHPGDDCNSSHLCSMSVHVSYVSMLREGLLGRTALAQQRRAWKSLHCRPRAVKLKCDYLRGM